MSYNPYSHDSEPASASSIVIREVEIMHEQDVYHPDNENENSPFYDNDASSLSEGARGVDSMSEGSQRSSRGRRRGHGLRDKDWYHTVVEASMDNLKNTKYVDIEKAMADVQEALTLPMHMRPDINLCGTLELGMMNIVNYQEGLRLKRMNQAIDHIVAKGKELRKEERKKRNVKNENNDEAMGNGEVDILDLEANFVFPLTYEEQFPDSPPPVYDESQPREEDGIMPPVERTKKNHDLLIEAWAGLGMPSDATDQQMDEFMMAHSQASYDRMIEESQKRRAEEEEGSIPYSAPSAGMFSLVPSSVRTPEIILENQEELMSDRTPSPPNRKKQTRNKKADPYDEMNPHPGPYGETQLPTIRANYPKIKKELEEIDEMHPWISEDDDANLMNNLSLHPDNVARASQGQGINLRPMVDDEPSEEYSASLSSGMEIYKSALPGSEIEPAERDPLEVVIDEDYKDEMDTSKEGIYDNPLEMEAPHHGEEDEKIHHVESPGDSKEGANKWDVLAAEGQEPRVDVQYWDSIIKGRQKFEPRDEFENPGQYHDFFYHLLFRANQGLVDILPQEYADGGVRWRVLEEDGDENFIDLLEVVTRPGDHQAIRTPYSTLISDDPLTPKNSEESLHQQQPTTCIGVESFHHSGSNSNARSWNPLITLMTPREAAGDPKDEIENDENTQNTVMPQPSGSQHYADNSQNTMIQQQSGSHRHDDDDDGKEGDDEDGESDTDNRDFVRGSMIRSQNATQRLGHFYKDSGDHTQCLGPASEHLTRGQEELTNAKDTIMKDINQRIRTSTAGNTERKYRESRTTSSSRDSTKPITSSNNNNSGNSNPKAESGHGSSGMSQGRKKTDGSQTQSLSSRMAAALAAKDA